MYDVAWTWILPQPLDLALLYLPRIPFLLSHHQHWPMGISGLPGRIKHGERTPPNLKGKGVHVDAPSVFYGFKGVRSYLRAAR